MSDVWYDAEAARRRLLREEGEAWANLMYTMALDWLGPEWFGLSASWRRDVREASMTPMRLTVEIEHGEREETAVFEVRVLHYDSGRYGGPPEDCYPAEFEFDVDSVTIDGVAVSPVPEEILAAYQDLLDDEVADAFADEVASRYGDLGRSGDDD